MTIRIDTLKKISSVLNSKDAGCYGYIAGPNFVFVGSKDAFTGRSLIDSINFSEKEIAKLTDLGLQYIGEDSTWIMSVFNLGQDRSVERHLNNEPNEVTISALKEPIENLKKFSTTEELFQDLNS